MIGVGVDIAGPGEAALRALSPSQLAFLDSLPKAELHAHLNGSIPLPLLQDLAREYTTSPPPPSDDATAPTTPLAADILAVLQTGTVLESIDDFFPLFSAIYALTSTPASLKRVTRGVLSHFLDPAPRAHGVGGAVAYIELRTTPRATAHMSRRVYLETVLDEVEARAPDAAALIVSLDRRMTPQVAQEVLELTVQLRREGRRIVGMDLCGNPKVRCVSPSSPFFFFFLRTEREPPSSDLRGKNREWMMREGRLNAFFFSQRREI
jgi:adenosine deaminase